MTVYNTHLLFYLFLTRSNPSVQIKISVKPRPLKSDDQLKVLKSRLSLIVWVNIVLDRTVVVDSD